MLNSTVKFSLLVLMFTLLNVTNSVAQCAMCKATLENQEEGGIGGSINEGILFLMPMPYILLAVIGGVFYYRNKKKKATQVN